MITILYSLLSFILVFFIVVLVHEYGHFWVARRMGVRVLRFSIGFGPILWKKIDRYGTEFAIASIPLGGYVKMLDGREHSLTEEEKPYAFDQKSVGKRIAIVVAGPLFNFLFAILAYTCMLMIGVDRMAPLIAHVQAGSPAAQMGIQAGDEFVSIDHKPTPDGQSVYLALLQRMGEQGHVDVVVRQFPDHPVRAYTLPLTPNTEKQKKPEQDPLAVLGITLGLPLPPILGEIVPNGAAAQAGLLQNDKVMALDQQPVQDWFDLVEYVRARANQPIEITINRDGHTLVKTVTPVAQEIEGQQVGAIGVKITLPEFPPELRRTVQENVFTALYQAVINTWDLSLLTFDIMRKMLIGLIGLDNLSGPISIAQGAQQSVTSGWVAFVGFLILLSVNLGVINLLPIPMLDGGHLLYYVLEWIRGKPLSEKAQRIGLVFGLLFVLGLMLVGLRNDISGLM